MMSPDYSMEESSGPVETEITDPVLPPPKRSSFSKFNKPKLIRVAAIFACLIIILAVGFFVLKNNNFKADVPSVPAMIASSFYTWPTDSSFTTFAKIDGTQTDGKTISLAQDSTGGGASTNVNDLFSGSTIDSKLWSATSDISMINNKLNINHTAKTPASDLSSKFTLSGDFDVQVSYSDLAFTGNTFSAVGLRATGLTLPFNIESRYNGGGGVLFTDMLGVALAGTSTFGTFRIQRTGSTGFVYQNDGIHVWQQRDVGTGDVTIDIYGRDDNYGGSVQANMSNFKATSSGASAIKKYVTTGTAILEKFIFKEGKVHLKNAVVDKTDNGGTIKVEYSTDNFGWKEDVKDLDNVPQLFIRVTLTTTDTAKTPVLNKISLEYVPVVAPQKPVNVSPTPSTSLANKKPELKASDFIQPDGATLVASQWEMSLSPVLTSTGKFQTPVPGNNAELGAVTTYVPNMSLSPDKKYFWHVRYRDSYNMMSSWSDATVFTIKDLPQPVNIFPEDQVIGDEGQIEANPILKADFLGQKVTGTRWRLQLAKDSLAEPLIYDGTSDDTFKIKESLKIGEVYGWSVQYWVGDITNASPWSKVTFFKIDFPELATPSNELPVDGAEIDVSSKLVLKANFNGVLPDSVEWVISDMGIIPSEWRPDPLNKIVNNQSNTFVVSDMSNFEKGETYFWKVRITKGTKHSAWSVPTDIVTKGVKPIVQTLKQTNVTTVSAVFNGNIVSTDGVVLTTKGFMYGLAPDESVGETVWDNTNLVAGPFSLKADYLDPDKTYYFRAFTVNGNFRVTGDWLSFKTLPAYTAPKVTTLPPTDITSNSFSPHGNITDTGGTPVTKRGFQATKVMGVVQADYGDAGSFNIGVFTKSNVTLSLPNTTYYVRAYATNSVGTTYGAWLSFKSLPLTVPITVVAPKVTTLAPTYITTTTAVPNGSITGTGGSAVTYRGFQYSKTNNGTALVGTYDSGTFDVGAYTKLPIISSLTPNTTYYVRAFAINAAGTTYADWMGFKTLPAFTLTASASAGGIIFPSGVTNLARGSSQKYIIVPSVGYKLTDVKVDGQSVGAVLTYAFTNVSSNHTIAATFALIAPPTTTAQGLVISGDKVVAGATVEVVQDGTPNGLSTTFYSDQNGVYKITGLSVASYYITVTAPVCTKYLIWTFCSNMQKTNYFTLTAGTNTVIPTFIF